MPRKTPPTQDPLESALDDVLGRTLAAGWDEPPAPAPEPVQRQEVHLGGERKYPPVPVREYAIPDARSTAGRVKLPLAVDDVPAFPEDDQDESEPEGSRKRELMNIGILAELAANKITPDQAAERAGVSMSSLQDSLATTLKQMDAKEIAAAMGLQAVQEQLKAGALFGMVVHDLVQDMVAGKLAPALKLQLAEMLSKIGRVMPKEDKGAGVSGGFVLNISMSQPNTVTATPVTIEAD